MNRTLISITFIIVLLVNAGYLIFMTFSSTTKEDQEVLTIKLVKEQDSLVTHRSSFKAASQEGETIFLKGISGRYEVGILERKGIKRINGVKKISGGKIASVTFLHRDELNSLILFVRSEAGNTTFYKIEKDASGLPRALPVIQEGHFDYSPNKKELVFVNQENIWKLKTDGSALTQLTSFGKDDTPRWSPDQSQIAFTSSRDGNKEIYVMNADGSGQTNITRNPHADFSPDWSPCGQKIAFTSNRDGDNEIFLVYPRNNRVRQLTENKRSDSHPVWAPDGHKIAVLKTDWKGAKNLYTIGFNGRTLEQLTAFGLIGFGENAYTSWKNEKVIEFTDPRSKEREEIQVKR